jgi:molecular chaperone GrpE|tara:strand:- start:3541 stop:4047 length:507 start_codon:yes stop_codon:yes gene_type:complete
MMTDSNTSEEQIDTNEELVEDPLSELDQLKQDLEEANEAKLRALADFKNFQRRSVENETRAINGGKAQIVRSIIPSIEQMNLAIEHAGDDVVIKGFQMARDALLQGLADCGVSSINPEIGDAFDPQMHEALMREETDDYGPDQIVMVMQTGFLLGDIVVCPAKVTVSS